MSDPSTAAAGAPAGTRGGAADSLAVFVGSLLPNTIARTRRGALVRVQGPSSNQEGYTSLTNVVTGAAIDVPDRFEVTVVQEAGARTVAETGATAGVGAAPAAGAKAAAVVPAGLDPDVLALPDEGDALDDALDGASDDPDELDEVIDSDDGLDDVAAATAPVATVDATTADAADAADDGAFVIEADFGEAPSARAPAPATAPDAPDAGQRRRTASGNSNASAAAASASASASATTFAAPRSSARPFVERLRGNAKAGSLLDPCDVMLGERTLIVGDNGSGKTAIQQRLTLALAGVVYDHEHREVVKAGAELASLMPPGADRLEAEATVVGLGGGPDGVSSGAFGSFRLQRRTDGSLTRPVHTPPPIPVRFPLQEALAELRGSPERARRWLLQAAVGNVSLDAISEALPEALRASFRRLLDGRLPPLEALHAAIGDSKRRAADASRDAEAAAGQLAAVTAATGGAPTEAELAAAEAAVQAAEAAERDARIQRDRTRAAAAANTSHAAKLAEQARYQQALHRREAELAAARTQLAAAAATDAGTKAQRRAAASLLLEAALGTGPVDADACACLACGAMRDRVQLDKRLQALRAADAAAAEQAAQKAKLVAQVADLEARCQRGRGILATIERDLKELAAKASPQLGAKGGAADEASEAAEVAVRDAAARATAARERRTSLQAVAKQASAIGELRRQREDGERRALEYGHLHAALERVAQNLVVDAAAAFAKRVQGFLPDEDRFWLDPVDGSFGLLERAGGGAGDGQHNGPAGSSASGPPAGTPGAPPAFRRSALSGAESTRVLAALGAAAADPGALNVLLPPDRAWREKALRAALGAWSKWPGQVVVTSTVMPWRGVPKGWTLVELPERG